MVQKNKGFTLVELLVVIAIISFLSSVVMAALGDARASARDVRRYNDLAQIQTALELYRNEYGGYPSTNGNWYTFCTNGSDPVVRETAGANGYIPNLAPKYITELPLDPLGCQPRRYDRGHFSGYIYRSDGKDYKFAGDWTGEKRSSCAQNSRYWDAGRGEGGTYLDLPIPGIVFCSVSTSGARLW